jgi:hypothetical protein
MASSPQHPSERPAVYTVGHSTRTIPEFVKLLNKGPVELVVDIRSVPRSRTNPQFDLDALPEALAAWQIGHMQIPELGGLRRKSKIVPPEVNGFWINQSFHNYADYALSGEFHLGLARLLKVSQTRRCAIIDLVGNSISLGNRFLGALMSSIVFALVFGALVYFGYGNVSMSVTTTPSATAPVLSQK